MAGKGRTVEQAWKPGEANEGGFWFQRENTDRGKRQGFASTPVWDGQQALIRLMTYIQYTVVYIWNFFFLIRAAVEKLHSVDDAFRRQLESLQASHQAEILRLANDKQKQIEKANQKVLLPLNYWFTVLSFILLLLVHAVKLLDQSEQTRITRMIDWENAFSRTCLFVYFF